MDFFSATTSDADDEIGDRDDAPAPREPWEGPPEAEVPVVLPASALISANDQAAIVLSTVRVFSSGVELGIDAHGRRGGLSEEEWDDLQDRVSGFGHRRSRRLDASSRLRVGILLADGSRVLAGDRAPGGGDSEVAPPQLQQTGGSGSGGDRFWRSSWNYWLWPLPSDGPLTVVADWPQLGLEEHSVVVDGSDLGSHAARARRIWPDSEAGGRGPQPTWSINF